MDVLSYILLFSIFCAAPGNSVPVPVPGPAVVPVPAPAVPTPAPPVPPPTVPGPAPVVPPPRPRDQPGAEVIVDGTATSTKTCTVSGLGWMASVNVNAGTNGPTFASDMSTALNTRFDEPGSSIPCFSSINGEIWSILCEDPTDLSFECNQETTSDFLGASKNGLTLRSISCENVDCSNPDNDLCTTHECVLGECIATPQNDKICDDPGDNLCRINWRCDAPTGDCIYDDRQCDDNEFCTLDWCDPDAECLSSYSTAGCGTDACTHYYCEVGLGPGFDPCTEEEMQCDDFNTCTTDICITNSHGFGECLYESNDPLCENTPTLPEEQCVDKRNPTDGSVWMDDVNDTCGDYEAYPSWCLAAHYFVNAGDVDASEACCACGGGDTPDNLACSYSGPYDDYYLRDYACGNSRDFESFLEAKAACCECDECTGVVYRRDDVDLDLIDDFPLDDNDYHFHIRMGPELRISPYGEKVFRKDHPSRTCTYESDVIQGHYLPGHVTPSVSGCEDHAKWFESKEDALDTCCGCSDCNGITCKEPERDCQMRKGPLVLLQPKPRPLPAAFEEEWSYVKDGAASSVCNYCAEEADKFYADHACDAIKENKRLTRLADAQRACCDCGAECQAITYEPHRNPPVYTLRRSVSSGDSPTGESSWQKC